GSASAQPQLDNGTASPRLYTIIPGGAKVGSTVELTFTGLDTDYPEQLRFGHPGIKAEPVQPTETPDPKKPAPQVTKFKVSVAPDVPVGAYDVRLVGKFGVSNPRTFVVGDLAEVMEKEPNNDVEQAQRVDLNSTINGSMTNPTDVDYYVFKGTKGQRVVF